MVLREIYHFSVKRVERSIVAAAAYIAGESLFDMHLDARRNFAWRRSERHDEIVYSELVLPGGRSESNESFWNRVTAKHRHPRAVRGRMIDAAIPAHLSEEQMIRYVWSEAQRLSRRYGVAVLVAIHRPPRQSGHQPDTGAAANADTEFANEEPSRNWHAHFLLSYCTVDEDGVLGNKQRLLDPNDCVHDGVRNFADSERPEWERATNEALEEAGFTDRVDHRTLLAQGSLDLPTKHLGPDAWAAERSDVPRMGFRQAHGRNHSRIGDYNRAVRALNELKRRERSLRAAQLAKHVAQKKEDLKTLEASMNDEDRMLSITLRTRAAGNRLLKVAIGRRCREHIRRVDCRNGLVFTHDGGCFQIRGRHLHILDGGSQVLILAFAQAEGLTQLHHAAYIAWRRSNASGAIDPPVVRLSPDHSQLQRGHLANQVKTEGVFQLAKPSFDDQSRFLPEQLSGPVKRLVGTSSSDVVKLQRPLLVGRSRHATLELDISDQVDPAPAEGPRPNAAGDSSQ